MTPSQRDQLNAKLIEIQQALYDFDVLLLVDSLDDLAANQLIASTRMKLHLIDLEFMSLYKLMATFNPTHPLPSPTAPRKVPTLDDLEI
jgi:hypothetical protein